MGGIVHPVKNFGGRKMYKLIDTKINKTVAMSEDKKILIDLMALYPDMQLKIIGRKNENFEKIFLSGEKNA